MSTRTFLISIGLLAGLLLLCATPFPGAMIGFFAGITVAFFVVPAGYLAQFVLNAIGITLRMDQVLTGLAGVGILLIAGAALGAGFAWRRGEHDAARAGAFTVLLMIAIPLGGWLSAEALARAWH